jgi:hypothetical protein
VFGSSLPSGGGSSSYVIQRVADNWGYCIDEADVAIVAAAGPAVQVNVFRLAGSVMILDQWAVLTEVNALANCTDVYADLWDGVNSVKLSAGSPGGADLSGCPVGSMFTKGEDRTEPYTVMSADQCRSFEPDFRRAGRPFIITAKHGAGTYIRFNLEPGADVDFKMLLHFDFLPYNGGTLEFLL